MACVDSHAPSASLVLTEAGREHWSLKLELQTVVDCHVGTGRRAWVLPKSS